MLTGGACVGLCGVLRQSMEASGLELKLKHTLRKSTGADAGEQYQPAQLDRHTHKRRRHEEQQQQPHWHSKVG